ncbi:MAG: hypothetical protein U1C96_07245 [Gallionella sp.]|nr:hypothetical protein [Gallionella sp.]
MTSISIRCLTPDNRPWRIDWFGELSFPGGTNRRSQPCVRVAISPVLCDPSDQHNLLSATSTDSYAQKQIWLPIGMLPYVQIGDIWQSKRHSHTPDYQRETFRSVSITRETTNFIKAGLPINNEYVLPLAEHPWHRHQTQSYCIIVKLANEKRIVIPCMEMIRFYFGSSSTLLHRLFSSQISHEPLWKSKHHTLESGHLHLKLADGVSGASASDIGRIALNQEARHAARLIFDTCLLALLPGEPVYPYTGFPFIGHTNLTATGKWLSFGDKEDSTFVVYRLESCSHPFPFTSLTYEVSDSSKVRRREKKVSDAPIDEQNAVVANTSGGKQTLSEDDPGRSKSSKEHWVKKKAKFPDLLFKPVIRERYDTVDAPEMLLKKMPEDEKVSVGTSHGNSKVRSVDVVSYTSTDISAYEGKLPEFVREGIKTVTHDAGLDESKVSTSLITPPGYSSPVISLPLLIDEEGEIDPISFCQGNYGEQRVRRGCFVTVNEGEVIHRRALIVEGELAGASPNILEVREYDPRRAIEMLLWQRDHIFSRYRLTPNVTVTSTS